MRLKINDSDITNLTLKPLSLSCSVSELALSVPQWPQPSEPERRIFQGDPPSSMSSWRSGSQTGGLLSEDWPQIQPIANQVLQKDGNGEEHQTVADQSGWSKRQTEFEFWILRLLVKENIFSFFSWLASASFIYRLSSLVALSCC